MSSFAVLVLCFQACLFQNALGWIAEPGCGAGLAGRAGSGLASGIAGSPFAQGLANGYGPGLAGLSSAALAEAGLAGPLAGAGISGAYGGEGIGDVAVAGEMPVAGTTMVAGQVPILGAVRFAGDLPAGGVVSIAGSTGCGCGRSAYLY